MTNENADADVVDLRQREMSRAEHGVLADNRLRTEPCGYVGQGLVRPGLAKSLTRIVSQDAGEVIRNLPDHLLYSSLLVFVRLR
ncbi:hypothetical protein J6590_032728 [Homalodisca vitripennis]|nr:hypothetical protein J6590_032728 [Homalodisca vitripennis]